MTTAAERWTGTDGFDSPNRCRNTHGELISELLDSEPRVRRSGVVHERWTFPDGASVVLRFVTWELEQQ